MANLDLLRLFGENLCELIVNTLLDVYAVRGDTSLASVTPFEGEQLYTTILVFERATHRSKLTCCRLF